MNIKLRKNKNLLIKQTITENGITLIALVVTIVVLLILAGVTITMVLGEDGIIAQAKLAAEKTKEAEEQAKGDLSNLTEEISNILTSEPPAPTRPTATPSPTPTPIPTIKEAIEKGADFAKDGNKEITDGEKNMWVPQGYTVVDPTKNENVSYTDNNNPKIDEGIVITDAVDGTGKSTGNEFVWVPVDDIDTMAKLQKGSQDNWEGKLYDFTKDESGNSKAEEKKDYGVGTTNYREPDTVSNDASKFSSIKENDYKDFKEQLQSEFNSMIASVTRYKGFYIGRYETSNLGTATPIVKKDQTPTTNTDWYTMYKNSKNIKKDGSGATSSMIWGCQWDAVMNWFLRSTDDSTKKYVTNSTDKGYYNQSNKTTTGSNPAYAVNKI